jgi:hypothetical protein
MSHDPLSLPLPHCHIESNGALIAEVQRIDTVDRVGRAAVLVVQMEWAGAVGACRRWRGGVDGCWDGVVECGRVELGWFA